MAFDVAQCLAYHPQYRLGALIAEAGRARVCLKIADQSGEIQKALEHFAKCGSQTRLADRRGAHLRNRAARLLQPLLGDLLGACELLGQSLGIPALKFSQEPNFAQNRHHGMRERIVKIASDGQALAHDGSIPGLVGEALHFTGADGNPAFELIALQGQLVKKSGKRLTETRHLVGAVGNLDPRGGILTHVGHGDCQLLEPPGEVSRPDGAQNGGEEAQAQRYPQNLQRQRIGALKYPFVRLVELHPPSETGDFIGAREGRARDEHAPPIRQPFESGEGIAARRLRSGNAGVVFDGHSRPGLSQKMRGAHEDQAGLVDHANFRGGSRIGLIREPLRVMRGPAPANVRDDDSRRGIRPVLDGYREIAEIGGGFRGHGVGAMEFAGDTEPRSSYPGRKPGSCRDLGTDGLRVLGGDDHPLGIGRSNPIEARVGRSELFEDSGQIVRAFSGRLGHRTRCANRAETGCHRLAQIGAQLIGFQGQAADVLLQYAPAGDASDPDRGGDRECCGQGHDQPYGCGAETAPRVNAGKYCPQFVAKGGVGHSGHYNW